MLSRTAYAAIAGVLACSGFAGAQTPTPITVRGLAYDSVRGAPLGSALVTIVEGGRQTTADSRGRFRFDSVAPGKYTFAMQHAAIDSLGFPGLSARVSVAEGLGEIRIAVPSFGSLWLAQCGTRPPKDSGFVYGTIQDASTGKPLANATVELTWIDTRVSRALAISQKRWHARTRSDPNGGYGICGVPLSAAPRVRATSDSGESGLIDLSSAGLRVQRRDLMIGPSAEPTSGHRGTITGRVTNVGGEPVADARVVMDEVSEVRTGPDGQFTIRDVPTGTRQLEILSIGMRPVAPVVDVVEQETTTIAAQLERVTLLDKVRVTASPKGRRVAEGFEERRKTGAGFAIDSAKIATHGTLSSAFRELPGVQVEYTSQSAAGRFSVTVPSTHGGRCVATLWVDGIRTTYDDLDAMRPSEIAAVEVYPQAMTVPMQFTVNNSYGLCGAVVVWTRWAFR
jgi:hypothetical protein